MIQFVSLLLGLVLGPREVELTVGPRVAAVEIRLDGERVAELARGERRFTIDFGADLEPHRLEAIARGADGRELGRAVRVVNYTHSNHGTAIALDPPGPDGRRGGRVVWRAVLEQTPREIALQFDGRPLETAEDGAFVLPAHDPARLHFLEAEARFEDGTSVRGELTFGGGFGEQTTGALTAIPVRSPRGSPWTPAAIGGWLLADGRPANVFTAHAGPARLFLLRDRAFVADAGRLRDQPAAQRLLNAATAVSDYSVICLDARPLKRDPGTFEVNQLPVDRQGGLPALVFGRGPLLRGHRLASRQRLSDALALAGARAASSNGRRAVLLMLGQPTRDDSRLSLTQAAHYLEMVQVPLFVWAPNGKALRGIGPPARAYLGAAGLGRILGDLETELQTQTVVWLEGEHLPREITLSATAPEGVELVR